MALEYLRGKLRFVGNETRLSQCQCELDGRPPLDELLAIANGNPNDINGATTHVKGLNYDDGMCVEVRGNFRIVGFGVYAFYLTSIHDCPNPNAPC
jgi:hypothetical protein